MIDKRGKREECEKFEQPKGVPYVKPISKRELNEKMKGPDYTKKGSKHR